MADAGGIWYLCSSAKNCFTGKYKGVALMFVFLASGTVFIDFRRSLQPG